MRPVLRHPEDQGTASAPLGHVSRNLCYMEAAERAASSLRLRSWSLRSRTLGPHRRLRGTSAGLRLSMPVAEFSFGSSSPLDWRVADGRSTFHC